MDRITLRTLTEKSTMKFGKYYDLTVRQILTLHGGKALEYLRWVYYNSSNISFCVEILNEIGIHEKIRIQKPSKVSKEEFVEFMKQIERTPTDEVQRKMNRKMSVLEKSRKKQKTRIKTAFYCSKIRLQNKNHGH